MHTDDLHTEFKQHINITKYRKQLFGSMKHHVSFLFGVLLFFFLFSLLFGSKHKITYARKQITVCVLDTRKRNASWEGEQRFILWPCTHRQVQKPLKSCHNGKTLRRHDFIVKFTFDSWIKKHNIRHACATELRHVFYARKIRKNDHISSGMLTSNSKDFGQITAISRCFLVCRRIVCWNWID